MMIIRAIILGALFGAALYWAGAANPRKLLAMLRLENLTLMKIIIFAIGFANVWLSISLSLGIFDESHLNIKSMNLGVIVGGLIFGVGFGWAGTCPGTCVAAAGGTRGVKKAIVAVIGGLIGAFVFSITYGFWKRIGLFRTMDWGKLTLFDISFRFPSLLDFGSGGLLVVGILFMIIACVIPIRGRSKNKLEEDQ